MRKQLGQWILDVTKYITTAGLIAPFITQGTNVVWFICVGVLDLFLLVVGLFLAKDDVKSKIKK